MKIKTIKIENFLGMRKFSAGLMGRSAKFSARNGAGKSTINNAVLWCLFGKDSNGNELDPKPRERGGKGDRIIGNTPTVEIAFDNNETLCRQLLEDYSDKKGVKPVYKGDKGAYFVNGVDVKKKDFDKRVQELTGDSDIFRIILDPNSFLTMHWQKRREILERMMGETKIQDVVASSLLDVLDGKPLKEALEIAKSALKKAEKKLETLPTAIEEAQRKVPANVGDLATLQKELDKVVKDRMQEEEICKNPNFGKMAELREKIATLRRESMTKYNNENKELDSNITELEKHIKNITTDIATTHREIDSLKNEIVGYLGKLDKLRVEYKEESEKQFQQDKCITCGQVLPDFLIEEYKAKFNSEKAENLKKIKESGKKIKELKAEAEKQLEKTVPAIQTIEKDRDSSKERLALLQKQKNTKPYTEPPEIAEIESELKSLSDSGEFKKSEKLYKLEGEEEKLRDSISYTRTSVENRNRVKELQDELETIGDTIIELKSIKNQIVNIQRTWNKAIEEKVNCLFEITKFRMTNEFKGSDDLEDTCEAMYDGIDYNKTLNTGAKVCMCVDVANTFQKHFGLEFPTIIDNSESVTDWIVKPSGQAIYLYAVENIDKLTMEVL
ncbi:MAG TPA: AAA family ATPase [bacterium]|nr:AAA family ATPase [bacterium]